ncbi:MAG: hypothetical protein RL385_6148 [Pseudomonadota bacterium]
MIRNASAAALAVAVAFTTWLPAGAANACTCAEIPKVADAKAKAAAIFEGRVLSVTKREDLSVRVAFSVVRMWKGSSDAERIELTTAEQGSMCGFDFAEGASYLVYADGSGQDLSTGLCGRTRAIDEAAEDLRELGVGITPVHIAPAQAAIASDGGVSADSGAAAVPSAAPKSGGCATGSRPGSQSALLWLGLPGAALFSRRRRRS